MRTWSFTHSLVLAGHALPLLNALKTKYIHRASVTDSEAESMFSKLEQASRIFTGTIAKQTFCNDPAAPESATYVDDDVDDDDGPSKHPLDLQNIMNLDIPDVPMPKFLEGDETSGKMVRTQSLPVSTQLRLS